MRDGWPSSTAVAAAAAVVRHPTSVRILAAWVAGADRPTFAVFPVHASIIAPCPLIDPPDVPDPGSGKAAGGSGGGCLGRIALWRVAPAGCVLLAQGGQWDAVPGGRAADRLRPLRRGRAGSDSRMPMRLKRGRRSSTPCRTRRWRRRSAAGARELSGPVFIGHPPLGFDGHDSPPRWSDLHAGNRPRNRYHVQFTTAGARARSDLETTSVPGDLPGAVRRAMLFWRSAAVYGLGPLITVWRRSCRRSRPYVSRTLRGPTSPCR